MTETTQMAQTLAWANLYNFFAGVFSEPPTEQLVTSLRAGDELAFVLGTELVGGYDLDCNELARAYTQLLVGPGLGYVPPFASVYLDRQDDGRRPAKPLLWGDAGVRARQVYRQANLELAPGGMQVPDHLGVELQFLHHLCGREAGAWSRGDASEAEAIHAQQVAFARDHLLVWLPEFYVRVEEANAHPFYRAVTRLLLECLRAVVGG